MEIFSVGKPLLLRAQLGAFQFQRHKDPSFRLICYANAQQTGHGAAWGGTA